MPDTGIHSHGWSREFPATLEQVREARLFLAGLLNGHEVSGDAAICLSELTTNAIQHSRSAEPGGTFTVRLRRSGSAIRIEVTDRGGPWATPPDDDQERGRGLAIVRALTARHGIMTSGPPHDPHGRVVWYELEPLS